MYHSYSSSKHAGVHWRMHRTVIICYTNWSLGLSEIIFYWSKQGVDRMVVRGGWMKGAAIQWGYSKREFRRKDDFIGWFYFWSQLLKSSLYLVNFCLFCYPDSLSLKKDLLHPVICITWCGQPSFYRWILTMQTVFRPSFWTSPRCCLPIAQYYTIMHLFITHWVYISLLRSCIARPVVFTQYRSPEVRIGFAAILNDRLLLLISDYVRNIALIVHIAILFIFYCLEQHLLLLWYVWLENYWRILVW